MFANLPLPSNCKSRKLCCQSPTFTETSTETSTSSYPLESDCSKSESMYSTSSLISSFEVSPSVDPSTTSPISYCECTSPSLSPSSHSPSFSHSSAPHFHSHSHSHSHSDADSHHVNSDAESETDNITRSSVASSPSPSSSSSSSLPPSSSIALPLPRCEYPLLSLGHSRRFSQSSPHHFAIHQKRLRDMKRRYGSGYGVGDDNDNDKEMNANDAKMYDRAQLKGGSANLTSQMQQKKKLQHRLDPTISERHPDPSYNVFTCREIGCHLTTSSCWLLISGRVYDITSYLPQHPAGEACLLRYAGTDVTEHFHMHSNEAQQLWETFHIGWLQGYREQQQKCNIM